MGGLAIYLIFMADSEHFSHDRFSPKIADLVQRSPPPISQHPSDYYTPLRARTSRGGITSPVADIRSSRLSVDDIRKRVFALRPLLQTPTNLDSTHTLTRRYETGDLSSLAKDGAREYVSRTIASHRVVFVLSIGDGLAIPRSWVSALESCAMNYPEFAYIRADLSQKNSLGVVYVDGDRESLLTFSHDAYTCTPGDEFLSTLGDIIEQVITSPIASCRGSVRSELHTALSPAKTSSVILNIPKPRDVAQDTLNQWGTSFANHQKAENVERLRKLGHLI